MKTVEASGIFIGSIAESLNMYVDILAIIHFFSNFKSELGKVAHFTQSV